MTLLTAQKDLLFLWIYGLIIKFKFRLSYKCHMLIFPDNDAETNYYAIMHLPDYKNRFYLKRIVLVSSKPILIPSNPQFEKMELCSVILNPQKVRILKKISRTHGFFIFSIGLDSPKEKKNKYMVDVNGLTKEDILCRTDYYLFNYKKAKSYGK